MAPTTTRTANARDLSAAVGGAYWNLYFARQNLTVRKQLTGGARRVLETVTTRAAMGADPMNSILQAEVGVARREEEIVVAEGDVLQTEDRLRALMGLDRDPTTWDLHLIPEMALTLAPFDGDLVSGLALAIDSSPAYSRAQLHLQSTDLQVELARDQTRPQVDLIARVGVTGIGGSYGDNVEVLSEGDGRSWRGGVTLGFPLGQNPGRQRFNQRVLEKQREEVDLERLRLDIVQQVRQQHRRVGINQRRVEVSQLAERLAEQNVTEEEERLALGLSTVRQVLDAQDDLAESRSRRLQAIVDYNKALVEWRRLTGA